MKPYKVLFDRLAVRPLTDPGKFVKTGSLFSRPDMSKKYLEAEVVALGETVKSSLQIGDRVICDDWLGEEGMLYRAEILDGVKVLFMKEKNVMAKVTNGNET